MRNTCQHRNAVGGFRLGQPGGPLSHGMEYSQRGHCPGPSPVPLHAPRPAPPRPGETRKYRRSHLAASRGRPASQPGAKSHHCRSGEVRGGASRLARPGELASLSLLSAETEVDDHFRCGARGETSDKTEQGHAGRGREIVEMAPSVFFGRGGRVFASGVS